MFKQRYKEIYHQILPSEHLKSATLAHKRISKKAKPLYKKPVFVGIAIMLCFIISIPVLAVHIPVIDELLYQISPSTAQFFKPVQKSDENNGIRMEVVSAYIHDNVAEIYISLQDLTGNRIDATTDLFDSYSIRRPFSSIGNCQLIGFDESSKTAMFLISITEIGNKKITGDKITFSVNEFISGKQIYDGVRVEIDLSDVSDTPDVMPLEMNYGGGYSSRSDSILFKDIATILKPSAPINIGINGIEITGIGYVNGFLHIQTYPGNINKNDNHGYVYLKNEEGNVIEYIYTVGYNDYVNGEQVRYNEFAFDIQKSELHNYELFGYFVISGIYTAGSWQITFPLE